jgi:hypothetical protein
MHSVLDFVDCSELEDVWLDEFFLELADIEAVVADDLEEADPEEPIDDVLLFALFADQQELLLWSNEVGNPVGYWPSAWQPVRSFDYTLADVHTSVHDLGC